MAEVKRITLTLPAQVVRDIDRLAKNRSKFVADAVRNEVQRRLRAELRQSLENPHPNTAALAELGMEDWARSLPDDDTPALLDPAAGKPVRWVPGTGWVSED
jgi:Arc/MetJ-type ribon-helix-helix transcriptional regulator